MKMPPPNDIAGLRRSLGVANYLRRRLPSLMDTCKPMRELLAKDVAWQRMEKHKEAMKRVCTAVTQAPHPKSLTRTSLWLSSVTHLAWDWVQCYFKEGRLVEFESRALSRAEHEYAQFEKELLAVLFGLKHSDQYVYRLHVSVKSDHRPLQVIAKKPPLNRWCSKVVTKNVSQIVTLSIYVSLSPRKEVGSHRYSVMSTSGFNWQTMQIWRSGAVKHWDLVGGCTWCWGFMHLIVSLGSISSVQRHQPTLNLWNDSFGLTSLFIIGQRRNAKSSQL